MNAERAYYINERTETEHLVEAGYEGVAEALLAGVVAAASTYVNLSSYVETSTATLNKIRAVTAGKVTVSNETTISRDITFYDTDGTTALFTLRHDKQTGERTVL